MRSVLISTRAAKDLNYFSSSNRQILEKIKKLIRAIEQDPFDGIGKPEPLKFDLAGCWSRRIDHVNRLVYRVDQKQITIISCRYHY